MKSQRIPFAFAVQSLHDLNPDSNELFEWTFLPDVGDKGIETKAKILRPEIIDMTPTQGLVLTRELPHDLGLSSFADEPTIGCPATMVKNFVRDIHMVAAQACVQSGIIPLAEAVPVPLPF